MSSPKINLDANLTAPLLPAQGWPEIALNATQERQWQDTLAALSWIAPGFVHIIYTMMANHRPDMLALFTKHLSAPAATDGSRLIFNPDMFFKFTLLERVFVVLHETMHEIGNHCRSAYAFKRLKKITVAGKSLPWDDDYSNRMQDYVINAILIASKFGTFNKNWLFDLNVATDTDDWVTVYFRNWKDRQKLCPPKPKPGGIIMPGTEGNLPGQGQFDAHLDPMQGSGKAPSEAPERNEAAWKIAVNTGMEVQRAQGKLPAAMEMFFKEMLRPVVQWEDHIKGLMVRIIGQGAYDWRRLDRRLVTRGIGAPSTTGYGAEWVVIGGDSSGSIYADPDLIDRFFGEMTGIVEDVNPRRLSVVWCDAKVQRVDEVEDMSDLKGVYYKGTKGGGGTSFVPVFDWVHEQGMDPDCLLYLTDGDGTFPQQVPTYPVIWGDISKGRQKYKWGDYVSIPYNPRRD